MYLYKLGNTKYKNNILLLTNNLTNIWSEISNSRTNLWIADTCNVKWHEEVEKMSRRRRYVASLSKILRDVLYNRLFLKF